MGAAQQMLTAYGAPAAPVTWNPADKSAEITLSGSNLIATRTTTVVSDYTNVRGTAPLTGKKYWEVEITDGGIHYIIGAMTSAGGLNTYIGADVFGWGYANQDGAVYHNGVQIIAPGVLPAPTAAGTVFGFAYDSGDTHLYLSINGVWVQGGDPVAGTGAIANSTLASGLIPATGAYTTAVNKRMTARFSGFTYTPPTGWSGI